MIAEYNGGSATSELRLYHEDINHGMYTDSTTSESLADSLLNTNVRPKELLEIRR
jgi:hypothetical protein